MIGMFITAWLDVRSKPLRTFAAIAGMVAAIVAVVLVDAAGSLSRDANDEYLARNYGLPVTMAITSREGQSDPDQDARLVSLLSGSGFTAMSLTINLQFAVRGEGGLSQFSAMLVSPAYRDIRIVDMLHGAWPVETARSGVARIVISPDAAMRLGFPDPALAVGQVLRYATGTGPSAGDVRLAQTHAMVIDGVAATTTNAFDSSGMLIVSDLPEPVIAPLWGGFSLLVRVNPHDMATFQQLVGQVTNESGEPIFTTRRVDQSDQLAPVLEQQQVTARIVTIVALTIGGLGILGVGIASVRERARDFGLRRALGASKTRIFAGVIVQTLIEVLLAAALAIFIAALVLERYARDLVLDILPLPASTSLPVRSALLGLLGAVIVALIAGLIPAITAARSSVVRALKA